MDLLGNISSLLAGVAGGAVGFLLIAMIALILFIPILFWLKQPARHSGLERFAASLNHPDQGWDDRIPPDLEREARSSPDTLHTPPQGAVGAGPISPPSGSDRSTRSDASLRGPVRGDDGKSGGRSGKWGFGRRPWP